MVEADHTNKPLAVPATGAAELCSVSRSYWWKLHSKGGCPSPIHLGRKTLWLVDELHAWLAAGCPDRVNWQELRKSGQYARHVLAKAT